MNTNLSTRNLKIFGKTRWIDKIYATRLSKTICDGLELFFDIQNKKCHAYQCCQVIGKKKRNVNYIKIT